MSEWINVLDRVPDNDRRVLILNAKDDVAVGWYAASGYFDTWDDKYNKYCEPIFWAEIPKWRDLVVVDA